MPCPPSVPISIIPPTSQGGGPLVWQNGNIVNRLNAPLNSSLFVYNGGKSYWADGSALAPIYLPNLQQNTITSSSYILSQNTQGQLGYVTAAPLYVGQYTSASQTTGVTIYPTPANVVSITLAAGVWDISGIASFTVTLGVFKYFTAAIVVGSGGFVSAPFTYTNTFIPTSSAATYSDVTVITPTVRTTLASPTTIYLYCATGSASSGSYAAKGQIQARQAQ